VRNREWTHIAQISELAEASFGVGHLLTDGIMGQTPALDAEWLAFIRVHSRFS
jgi:hypothetical protein